MKQKQITVLGFSSQEDCQLGGGACVEDFHCDTIAEAKRRARYILTDDFMRMGEMSEPLGYSQVLVNGECHSDFFRP